MEQAYEEVIDFIAAGTTPHGLAAFSPSDTVKERVSTLLSLHKNGTISAEERSELEHYLQLEHLMRLAKARAARHLVA